MRLRRVNTKGARSGGEHPQIACVLRHLAQGQQAVGGVGEPHPVTDFECREFAAQGPLRHDIEEDLEQPCVRRVDQGVRPTDAFLADIHTNTDELAGDERWTVGLDRQRKMRVTPLCLAGYLAAEPLRHVCASSTDLSLS